MPNFFVSRNKKLQSVASLLPGDVMVYSMQDCVVRIQNPADLSRGGTGDFRASMIPPQTFNHTVAQVDATINDYDNINKRNIPLWLNGDYALRYAGIDKRLKDVERMVPQAGLSANGSLVTIILPTAFASGVRRIEASAACREAQVRAGSSVAAFGLNGTVASGQIVGATVTAVTTALAGNRFLPFPKGEVNSTEFHCLIDIKSGDISSLIGTNIGPTK
ncbi:hypothetical protein BDZ94DRAFT_1303975 [Collybia nuda]|uniref:Uncharacterized protein n=1 Tax=Collybia nuda TaxID=64659 RepID=A0A9P5YHM9_9AGAR|nr:hypothetical protein BDZ94DRAFT_1303975 [Collybia nuda]